MKINLDTLKTAPATTGTKTSAERSKDSKSARAIAFVASGITFLNSAASIAQQVTDGTVLELGDRKIDAASPASAACELCGQTHGVKGHGKRIGDRENFARTLIFQTGTGKVLFFGNSGDSGCFEQYLRPAISAAKVPVGNIDALRAVVGGFTPKPATASPKGSASLKG